MVLTFTEVVWYKFISGKHSLWQTKCNNYEMEENLWNTTLLSDLPFEILELILSCSAISFVDVCNFSRTCSVFRCVGNSNKLWRIKYREKWFELSTLLEGRDTDWKKEFCKRYQFGRMINRELAQMSKEFYLHDNVSNDAFEKFQHLLDTHVLAYKMLIDELERIIHDGRSADNLTQKYYAKRVLRFVRHLHLKEVWQNYLKEPTQNQCLEVGACLLAQWCQPTRVCCTKTVIREIDDIANRVREKVKEVSPKHPVLQIDLIKQGHNLTHSLWTSAQCRVVLLCINDLLFKELKFCETKNDFYCADNTYIDQVLARRTGIPISLGILYAGIARRLGVACLPVNFPGHFLLKWLEHPHLDDREAYTYIDVHDGMFRSRRDCFDCVPGYQPLSDSWFETVSPVKVFIRMCWNLVEVGRQLEGLGEGLVCLCNALELLSILNPDDAEHKLLLARVYLHLCINFREVISLIQEVSAHDPTTTGVVGYMYQAAVSQMEVQRARAETQTIVPKVREKDSPVKFAVGMIMKHMKYNYRCVIYAWDSECTASNDWIRQMGVHNLAYQEKQPFYHVLANDGSNRYAAQENLEIDLECKPVSHPDVGRYFEAYRGTYYVPNEQKSNEYPDDASVRESLFSFGEYFMYKDKSPFTNSTKNCPLE